MDSKEIRMVYRGFEMTLKDEGGRTGWGYFVQTDPCGTGFSNLWEYETREEAEKAGKQTVDEITESQKRLLRKTIEEIEKERRAT